MAYSWRHRARTGLGELGVLAFKRGHAQWSEGDRDGKDELAGYALAALDELTCSERLAGLTGNLTRRSRN